MRRSLVLLFLTAIANSVYPQDFSNKGKDFWICYPAHIDGTSSAMGIYITSNVNATGQITVGGTTIPFTLTANTVVRKFLGPNGSGDAPNTSIYLNGSDVVQSGAGIHVTSDKPVAVYAHIIRSARSGATLVLPVKVWGREYVVPSYQNVGQGGNNAGLGEIAIMASSPNTVVEITPTVASRDGTRQANIPFNITLPNAGDVYQLQFAGDADISGTKVKSIATATGGCKPIAVFSATTWSAFDCSGSSGGDNLYQQLFPTGAWGKKFITTPFTTRPYDIIRVFIKNPATLVTRFENGTLTTLSGLSPKGFYEFKTSNPVILEADEPISVVQYMVSQTCSGCNTMNCSTPADPEMVVINPIEQTVNNITVFSAHRNFVPSGQSAVTQCYLNITLPTAAIGSFKINGSNPTGNFNSIPGTSYSYLQENVTSLSTTNPVQTLSCDSSFIAIAYGYGQVESYGYNAGTNVLDLYQYVTIENEYATVNFPAGCKNSPLKFSMTFPYQPLEIKWVFGPALNALGVSDTTLTAPVADSSWLVNGRTLYRYKLNRLSVISGVNTYPIKVIANNPTSDGCSGEQEIDYDLQIFDRPVADFNFTHNGCLSDSVVFTDNSNGQGRPVYKWSWDFADGSLSTLKNPKHLFSTADSFIVKFSSITDVGCLSDTVQKTIYISNPPVADFSISSPACEKTSLDFSDLSVPNGTTLAKWTWNFGDGNTTIATNGNLISHIYSSSGSLNASLQVETSTGCKSTITTKPIIINPRPVASFNLPAAVCLPLGAAQFTNASTISDGSQNSFTYSWNFGDGNSSLQKDPLHNYNGVGPFSVKLQVQSNNGCMDDSTRTLTAVYPQPKLDLISSPVEVCEGDSAVFVFSRSSQGGVVNFTSMQFNNCNGSGSINVSPSGQVRFSFYLDPAQFGAATNNCTFKFWGVAATTGCISDTISIPVIVNELPSAKFTIANPTCVTRSISFTDASVPNSGLLSKWNWDFGDGNTSNLQSPSHAYNTVGTYTVKLNVETNKGCKNKLDTATIQIHHLPVPNFITPEICLSDPFALFTDSSTIGDNSQSQFTYSWNFGDLNANPGNPNSSSAKNPQHRYISVGTYDVKLTVTSKDGCSKDTLKKFVVNGAIPKAAFTVNNAGNLCSNQDISIIDQSTVDFGSIVKVEIYWDYLNDPTKKTVDDNPAPGKMYKYKYADFGVPATKQFQIRFVSYSGINCINQDTSTIVVSGSPQLEFDPLSAVCEEEPFFQIIEARENSGLIGTGTYSGAGLSSTGIFNPFQAKPGLHTLRFSFTTSSGCSSFIEQTIRVNPTPILDAGPDRVVLEGGYIILNIKASGNNLSYLWTPNLAIDNNTISAPKVSPLQDITYHLLVTSADGCISNDNVFVKVLKQVKVPNAFSPNKDGINDIWEIQYLESYPGCTVEVYNRFGQLVFQSTGYDRPWDGTYKGTALPVGTYYWIINPKNGRAALNGSVTIIR